MHLHQAQITLCPQEMAIIALSFRWELSIAHGRMQWIPHFLFVGRKWEENSWESSRLHVYKLNDYFLDLARSIYRIQVYIGCMSLQDLFYILRRWEPAAGRIFNGVHSYSLSCYSPRCRACLWALKRNRLSSCSTSVLLLNGSKNMHGLAI